MMNELPKIRVLMVEDSATDAFLLRQTLMDLAGAEFEITHEQTLADAMGRFAESHFDVVLLDLGLPDSYGVETFTRLRCHAPNVPVLVLTGLDDQSVGLKTVREGAQDYLVKGDLDSSLLGRSIYYAIERNRIAAALLESQMRLSAIVSSPMDGIITVDDQHRITLINPAAEALFGYASGEMLGKPLDLLIPARYRRSHAGYVRNFGQTNVTPRKMGALGAVYGLRADGTEFAMEASISQITVAGRRLFTVIVRDISARLAAEEAVLTLNRDLQRRIEETETLLKVLPVAIGISGDPSCRTIRANPAFATLLELPLGANASLSAFANERPGNFKVCRHGRELAPDELPMQVAAAQGIEVRDFEEEVVRQDGSTSNILGYAAPLFDEEGAVRGSIGAFVDITERKRAEAALLKSREQLGKLIDQAPVSIAMFDQQMCYLAASGNWIVEFGRGHKDLIGRCHYDIHPDIPDEWKSIHQRAMGGEVLDKDEDLWVQADGRRVWVRWAVHPWRAEVGKVGGIIIYAEDITVRKRAEEIQARSQKLEALGTLAGGIAHDFNNILLAITGNAQIALSEADSVYPIRENLEEIVKASARATQLVKRILAFSRPQEQKHEITDLRVVVKEALKLMRATLPAMIDIQTDFAPDLPSIEADSTQMHQIIVNLATNSAHAIGTKGGVIKASLEQVEADADLAKMTPGLRSGRYVRMAITDTGCGMDSGTQERIFDPFFTTKSTDEGTGLGLSVVHGIVKAHQGAITVYSEPGKGTTFHLYFPAVVAAVEPARVESRSTCATGGLHVMYIDDEEPLVRLATKLLERLGHSVTAYTDPRAALEAFQQHAGEFDVVVSDLAMPKMSGFEVAREMLQLRPELPVILTSGYVRPQDRENATLLGIRQIVVKPYSFDALNQALNQCSTLSSC